jgi:hypothetical protein
VTIIFLLLPTLLTSPASIARLRSNDDQPESAWTRLKLKLADALESPIGRALPELHMAMFMFSGRFFEFGKRMTGIQHVSPCRLTEESPLKIRYRCCHPDRLVMKYRLMSLWVS